MGFVTKRKLALGLLAALWGCGDVATAPRNGSSTFSGTVSEPVAQQRAAASHAVPIASAASLGGFTFVSLSPGTEPDATNATIWNRRTGATVSTPVLDGGFDPIGIGAEAGDTLDIATASRTGSVRLAKSVVPATQPPRIVRTAPSRGRTDVAINATIMVIFSEPIDPAAMDTALVHLRRGSTAVAGIVRPQPGSDVGIEFVPASPLEPGAGYELVLSDRITDRSGDALEGQRTIDFTTAASSSVAPVLTHLRLISQPSAGPAGFPIWPAVAAVVVDESGHQVPYQGPVQVALIAENGATLSGTLAVGSVGGMAKFDDLVVSTVGTNYRLVVTAAGATSVTSVPFASVAAGAAGDISATVSFIEYYGAGDPGNWYYAPLVHLTHAGGQGRVFVSSMDFDVGLGSRPGLCFPSLSLAPGEDLEVFHEIYGDYQVTVDARTARSAATVGSASIIYRDASGRVDTLGVQGPIVPGAFPTTYTGGSPAVRTGGCFLRAASRP